MSEFVVGQVAGYGLAGVMEEAVLWHEYVAAARFVRDEWKRLREAQGGVLKAEEAKQRELQNLAAVNKAFQAARMDEGDTRHAWILSRRSDGRGKRG